MSIFAIGDLHLPGRGDKPMNVFGMQWDRHFETIQANWQKHITENDVVLIPGDISWAMQLENAVEDLQSIAALPGQKVILKGNHDYWWSSIAKVRKTLPTGMFALQNDSLALGGVVFCGTRGWTMPLAQAPLNPPEMKIYQRELGRLQISLAHAQKQASGQPLVVLMHFPPLLADGEETGFSQLLVQAGVSEVVYGHLHGNGIANGFVGVHQGVRYHLVSCDAIQFSPIRLSQTAKPIP